MIKTFSNALIWSFPLAYFPWQCRCSSDFTMICLAAALILIGIFSFKASKWHARSIENLTVNRSEYKNIYGQRGNRMREEKMIVHKSFINGHLHWTCGSQLNEHTLRNDIDNEEVFNQCAFDMYTTSIDQLRFIFKWTYDALPRRKAAYVHLYIVVVHGQYNTMQYTVHSNCTVKYGLYNIGIDVDVDSVVVVSILLLFIGSRTFVWSLTILRMKHTHTDTHMFISKCIFFNRNLQNVTIIYESDPFVM